MINHLHQIVAQVSSNPKILTFFLMPSFFLHQLISPVKEPGFSAFIDQPNEDLTVQEVSLQYQTTYNKNQATTAMSRFLGSLSSTAQYQVQTWLLSYEVELEDGSFSTAVAEVFVPLEAEKVLPLVVSTPGTTGLDDACAPSREPTYGGKLGNYENQMVAMASQGFLVIQPNYIGLDNPDLYQQYFIKDWAARSVLSSVLALRQIKTQMPEYQDKIVVGGYSQGGHVAFSTADLVEELAPSVEIIGIFGHGPTTDTEDLLRNNPNLAPFFVYTYSKLYTDFDPKNIFQASKLYQVDRAPSQCVNQAHAFNSANIDNTYTTEFGNAIIRGTLQQSFPAIETRMSLQDAGTEYLEINTLILQGTGDPIVTIEDQARFANSLCQRDIPVEMKRYTGVHHFQTRQVSFWDTLNWINNVYADKAEATYCP